MANAQHVFISYSRDDTRIMRRIKKTFNDSGIPTWTDEGIEIGTPNWQLAIEEAIENCACMVCVLTPAAKLSHWVREELVYATFHEKQVYMIHVRGDYKQVAILGFTVSQLIDVREPQLYEPRMTQLCKRIKDELVGYDAMVDTHQAKSLTYRLPETKLLLTDETELPSSEDTLLKPYMPATIPRNEQHQLIVQRGKEYTATTNFNIEATFITIGRDKASSIHIDDHSVSREHCQLIYTNEGFLMRDLDSVNGTYVNAERIRMRNLKNNDTIQIGPNVSLVYRVLKK